MIITKLDIATGYAETNAFLFDDMQMKSIRVSGS